MPLAWTLAVQKRPDVAGRGRKRRIYASRALARDASRPRRCPRRLGGENGLQQIDRQSAGTSVDGLFPIAVMPALVAP
eukprot:8799145-Pyramimonas_sp.AAC.1